MVFLDWAFFPLDAGGIDLSVWARPEVFVGPTAGFLLAIFVILQSRADNLKREDRYIGMFQELIDKHEKEKEKMEERHRFDVARMQAEFRDDIKEIKDSFLQKMTATENLAEGRFRIAFEELLILKGAKE